MRIVGILLAAGRGARFGGADNRAAGDAMRGRRDPRQQLGAAEARTSTRGKEDADDAHRYRSGVQCRKECGRPMITRAPPANHSASRRNLPSRTTTSTRARSSMPLWLVADMLNTPWVPTTS